MSNNYVIEFKTKKGYDAGFKARRDITTFATEMDFIPLVYYVPTPINSIKRALRLVTYLISIVHVFFIFKKKDTVLIQYPLFPKWLDKIFSYMLRMKGIVSICLIHDIESIRLKGQIDQYEISLLKLFSKIICHNEIMQRTLKEFINHSSVISLDLFDYAVSKSSEKMIQFESSRQRVAFAGNLSKKKSHFIYEIDKVIGNKLIIALYGQNYNGIQNGNVKYCGIFSPDDLSNINANWGLIWDGKDLHSCTGIFGEYLRMNNPHKASLYIAAGLPIITWSKSAIASFVSQKNIGITIDSLYDLAGVLNKITISQYWTMKKNVECVQNQVITGYYIESALKKIL